MTSDEHHTGQLYTVAKQSVDESNESKGKTAVEILENGAFAYTDDQIASMNEGNSVSGFQSSGSALSDTHSSSSSSSGLSTCSSLDSTASSSQAMATCCHRLPATPLSRRSIRQGQYTHKVYHVGGFLPNWLRSIAPASVMKAEERAWNCYPYCRTVMTNEYLGDRFHVIVETVHLDVDGATGEISKTITLPGNTVITIKDPDNVFELPPDTLRHRQVYHLDICRLSSQSSHSSTDTTHPDYKPEHDPCLVASEKLKRGPFKSHDNLLTHQPRMLVYKLVTIRCAIFGIQTRAETLILEGQCRLFHRFYRRTVCEMDSWTGLTIKEVREIEEEARLVLERRLDEYKLPTRQQ